MNAASQKILRESHRWLGLIAGIQLLLWTVSGLYFTLIPIETIRGNHLLVEPAQSAPITAHEIISPNTLVKLQPTLSELSLQEFAFSYRLGQPVYLIKDRVFDAASGEALPALTADEASQIVIQRTGLEPQATVLLTDVESDHEFRGGPLPVWQVQTDTENARFYVELQSGRIRAVRTDAWRWFDFLWALHIMDYESRDNFNHLLVQFLSILGLLTVLSGLVLFVTTEFLRRERRSKTG